jgi:hypothetical protein
MAGGTDGQRHACTLAAYTRADVFRRLIWGDAVVLLAALAFELALALGAEHVGAAPGDSAPGGSVSVGAASLAMLAGAVLTSLRPARTARSIAVLAPAAGLFLAAFFYTEDPYYAPSQRRFSDGGAVAGTWIGVVLAVSVIAGIVAWRRPREGRVLVAVALLVCLVATALAGDGH